MTQFLAIVADTWRQSVRQVVFIIMLVVLTLVTVGMAIVFKPVEPEVAEPLEQETPAPTTEDDPADDGGEDETEDQKFLREMQRIRKRIENVGKSERTVGWIFSDERFNRWREWNAYYLFKKKIESGERLDMSDMRSVQFSKELFEIEDEIVEKTGLSRYERSVQMVAHSFSLALFTLAMWLFIAACSGYFPGLMAGGAVDVVLSKPMSRLKIFLAKYVGGMILMTAALMIFHVLFYVALGLRFDVWHIKFLYAVPLEVFIAGVLFAILAFLGILFRNSIVPMLAGYFFYLVVDTALGFFVGFQKSGAFDEGSFLDVAGRWTRRLLPNFSTLKESAANATLSIPMDGDPFWTAGAWLVAALALGYWRFQRRDF